MKIYRCDSSAPLEPGDVSSKHVHDHRLGDVVRVVPGHDLVNAELCGSPIKGLKIEMICRQFQK